MQRLVLLLGLVVALAACAPRGAFHLVRGTEAGSLRTIFVASNRALAADNGVQFSGARGRELRFARADVSVPPGHQDGQIEWPRGATPDPKRHFVLSRAFAYPGVASFLSALDATPGGRDEVILFVHGYNTTNAEATYRLAQMAHDFDARRPVISFSWPSFGDPGRYAHDRDSVIYSRDALEDLLLALTGDGRKVMVVAHSMGSQLVMETLRQISIGGRGAVLRNLSGVALISPDIDPEVFVAQARRIDPFPEPFLLMVSERDKVLDFSAWLAGRPRRLGAITSTEALGGLPLIIVDLTDYAEPEGPGHDTAFAAPRAIELLRSYHDTN